MWPAKPKPDPELLALFEESARNVQRAALLLRDLLAGLSGAGRRSRATSCSASRRATGSPTTSCTGSRATARRRAALDAADVHALAGALDDIVDYAEEAADQLGLYGVEAPMEQARAARATCSSAAPSRSPPRCAGCATAPTSRPTSSRSTGSRTRATGCSAPRSRRLFANGIDPMMLIRWKDIFDTLEAAVDACETVANVLEGISIKRAHR